jgi:DNA invertase Pin-like site-specific DNA recombinase
MVLDKFIRADEAKSGQSLDGRTGLEELVTLAQQKDRPFDGIIVYETARFARDLTDALRLEKILDYCGVFLYFVTRDLDSRDRYFRKLFVQYASQDEEYASDSGARVHLAHSERVRNGYIASGRAYGYRNNPVPNPAAKWKNGRSATLGVERVIVSEQAEVVKRIFQMYAAGLGHRAIALKLNEESVPSSGQLLGNPDSRWSATTVAQILRDEKYIGTYIWNKIRYIRNPITGKKEIRRRPESEWERKEIPEWRIVSDDLWNAVANERNIRQGQYGKRKGGLNRTEASRKYLFSGLLYCEGCKLPFIAFRTHKGDVRYACDGSRIGRCTGCKSIALPILDAQLLAALSRLATDPVLRDRLVADYRQKVVAMWNEQTEAAAQIGATAEELRDKRDDLRKQANNIMDAFQRARGNSLLMERLNSIEAELANIDKTLVIAAETIPPLPSEEATRDLVLGKLTELATALTAAPEAVKQELSRHIDKLNMKLIDTPDGLRYVVSGDVRLFPLNDPDDVLLTGSFQRTCKQYTPISFPLKATLIVRAHEWEKRSKSPETCQKIGDANRRRWAERKKAKASVG